MPSTSVRARLALVTSASALAVIIAAPAIAQEAAQPPEPEIDEYGVETIIVTAQRQAESLQDVPIAVSAFTAAAMERQQIKNPSDLQLTLPNITFTKTNFTSSSFTIRGIGDLCVGISCDQATAVHLNGSPLFSTRLFETEFYDLERIEVLRGPQGTLFGRNATSGVVNIITAKPILGELHASGEVDYGNFDSKKAKAMVNVPLGDSIAVRLAGFYLNRDGYTKNLFDNSRLDDRDMYGLRGSLRFEITPDTTLDLFASYLHEDDSRLRIQKQLCQRDPTGVLGCLPGRLDSGVINGNATFVGTLGSREFLAIQGIPAAFGLGSLYGPDPYANFTNPDDVRTVNTDFQPTYYTAEEQYQARLDHDFGPMSLQLSGMYQNVKLESQQDYNLSVQDRSLYAPALNVLSAAAAGLIPGLPASYFAPIANALIPEGPNGPLCTSLAEETGTGSFGGHSLCSMTPQDFDRSNLYNKAWSAEAILTSEFDGPLNFLLGGIYSHSKLSENSYYVNAFGIDYVAGILGSFTALGAGLPPAYLGTPFYRNNTDRFTLKSYGLFGEAYYEFNEALKLTLGLRYNNDKKSVRARSTLASFLVPYGSTDAFSSPFVGTFDADAGVEGNQLFQERRVSFDKITGRAVLDWQIADNNLLYFSYARGYKSGGINPPLQPIFDVTDSFAPESIDAFEIGSKNTILDGAMQLNLTAFYYKYKDLQLSRIVARTSVNDNVDADIYGLEAESIIEPTRGLLVNANVSYLHTKVSSDKFLGNPRDPSGGRDDVVIIKDITNGSNCALVPTTAGNGAGANAFVGTINTVALGLQAPTAFPADSGLTSTGAFSICSVLEAAANGAIGAVNPALAALQPLLDSFGSFTVENSGVLVNLRGNQLPQAPKFKFSVGTQYTMELANGMTLVPRVDLTFTGESYGSIFNGSINRVPSYEQVNAQVQLNGPDDRWFIRAYVQNLFDNNAMTGQYVTDQSSGLFTNIFTLEPRRYGVAAGFRF